MTIRLRGPVAYVLGGGATLGAVQVGMLRALAQAGVRPDLVVATSVGALNGALLARHPERAVDLLDGIWNHLSRRDIFPLDPLRMTRALRGHVPSLVSEAGIERLARRYLGDLRLEDLALPLHVVAADQQTGQRVDLNEGPAVEALLASTAIPGVFPARTIGGRSLVDGGVAANCPMLPALDAGAATLVVMDVSGPCVLTRPPQNVVESLVAGFHHLTRNQSLAHSEAAAASGATVLHLPTPCTTRRSPLDFTGMRGLIDEAHALSVRFLADLDEPGPGVVGHLHRHQFPAA